MPQANARSAPAPQDGVDRRRFLAGVGTTALMISGAAVINPDEAWGLEVSHLRPQTMRTLIKLGRDIYPHDRLADRYYAIAMKGYDARAGADDATKALIEDGVTMLDALAQSSHAVTYTDIAWEADRVTLLHQIEASRFFQTIRSDLIVSLYNQKEVWPRFGYEGESASKGGYIRRGFDDIAWL
jgi:hypothetical protein